jgi:hypothetical protein
MRDLDIPSVIKVLNKHPEAVSIAGLLRVPANSTGTELHLGKLHDSVRRTAYVALVNCLRGNLLQLVEGEDVLPPQAPEAPVHNPIPLKDEVGVKVSEELKAVMEQAPLGTPTLATVKPPIPQAPSAPALEDVFVPPQIKAPVAPTTPPISTPEKPSTIVAPPAPTPHAGLSDM